MYYYRSSYPKHNQRFIGFGLPFLGGLVGGLLGSALFYPRPFYGYPRPFYGYPAYGPPVYGYPGYGAPFYY
ncbi:MULTISPECIES: hypothetical protein [Bacillaceae]|jgi:hypothetical protein|uniref:hypothetical protein n=1 Tax=Bacillaceae TaxID=186817 RepID=UPI000BA6DB30|nr:MULTISPECIES: hypothetical protein [Bacillaceae]MCM3691590.1 hypothetical protein [Neobacillus niacini]PAE42798.1 hypothetical protein CHI06_09745 [Bacillus sp. 7884-1]